MGGTPSLEKVRFGQPILDQIGSWQMLTLGHMSEIVGSQNAHGFLFFLDFQAVVVEAIISILPDAGLSREFGLLLIFGRYLSERGARGTLVASFHSGGRGGRKKPAPRRAGVVCHLRLGVRWVAARRR